MLSLSPRSSFSFLERVDKISEYPVCPLRSYLTKAGKGGGNSTDKGLEVECTAGNSQVGTRQLHASCKPWSLLRGAQKVRLSPMYCSCLVYTRPHMPSLLPCLCRANLSSAALLKLMHCLEKTFPAAQAMLISPVSELLLKTDSSCLALKLLFTLPDREDDYSGVSHVE